MTQIEIKVDDAAWMTAFMATPLSSPQGCSTPEEAARVPGCHVMSRERGADNFPKHYGILVSHSADVVVVRGYGDFVSPRFVWCGTERDYLALWECD